MAGRSIWDNLMYQSKYNPYGRQQQDDTTPTQGDIDEVASEPPAKIPPIAPMRQPQMPDVAPPLRFSTASMASNDDMMTDADYQRISERARGYSGFEARHTDLAGMREGLEKYLSQDQQVDLSPLAALTDAWTGSKFAQSYKAPTSAEERQLTAAKLQDMIAQKQAGLNEDEIKLINSQISGQQNALMKKMGLTAGMAAAASKPTAGQEKLDTEFAKTLQEYDNAGGYAEAQKNVALLDDAIAQLEANPDITGTKRATLSKGAGSYAGAVAPLTTKVGQQVKAGIVGGLKIAFPGAMSNDERIAYFSTAWDETLDTKTNIAKIKAIRDTIAAKSAAIESSGQHFRTNRSSLAGFKPDRAPPPPPGGGSGGIQSAAAAELARRKAAKTAGSP